MTEIPHARRPRRVDVYDESIGMWRTIDGDPLLTPTEQLFADNARESGFRIYRGGWPDFAIAKGIWGPAALVEVKSRKHSLTPEQQMMHGLLKQAFGVTVGISIRGQWPAHDALPNWFQKGQHYDPMSEPDFWERGAAALGIEHALRQKMLKGEKPR